MALLEESIFQKGSKTYYKSSYLFPKNIRDDVVRLYSFVRVADDYVDVLPHQKNQFNELYDLWLEAAADPDFDTTFNKGDNLNERVTKNIIHVSTKYGFSHEWIESFMESMRADTEGRHYATLDDTLSYVGGSAEVIGLMMAKIMQLPEEAWPFAQMQGRAMQWINFIRDMAEDNKLGRCYFPTEDLERFRLRSLQPSEAENNIRAFEDFMLFQLDRYHAWQNEAEKGYRFIPEQARKAIQAATHSYDQIAYTIGRTPYIVFTNSEELKYIGATSKPIVQLAP